MKENLKKEINPHFFVVVRSIVQNSDRKILLLKRLSTASHNPNQWEIPGGKLEHGENIFQGVQREIFEETNLIIKPLSDSFYCLSRQSKDNSSYQPHTYVEIAVDSIVITGNLKIKSRHTDCVWERLDNVFDYNLTDESRKILTGFFQDVDKLIKLDEPSYRPVIPVVRALLKKDNKYLLLRRSQNTGYTGMWELPGGKINALESIRTAAIREFFEEAGVVVEINTKPVHLNSQIQSVGIKKGYTYVNIMYEAKIIAGKIRLTDKHDQYKWMTKMEISKANLAPYMEIPLNEVLFSKE